MATLELDHVFCFVDPAGDWAARAERGGFALDAGNAHPGQGTRNRSIRLAEQYVECLWLDVRADAEHNPLRLDRRADFRTTGACPIGIGLRGVLPDDVRAEFWAYHPPYWPQGTIWVHRSGDELPLVFCFERDRRLSNPGPAVREVRLKLPAQPQAILGHVAPRVTWRRGARWRLEVAVGADVELTDELALVA
jgi:Glyoxalase-like domain